MRDRVAYAPPRSTLCVLPNQGSEYSLYGSALNPGYGAKSLAVHSQTLPIIWRQPNGLSLSGKAATSIPPAAAQSRFARCEVGESSPQGNRRLRRALSTGSFG